MIMMMIIELPPKKNLFVSYFFSWKKITDICSNKQTNNIIHNCMKKKENQVNI